MSGNISPASSRFPKSKRLLKHADFQRVYPERTPAVYGKHDGIFPDGAQISRIAGPRIGFTVGKVLGGAVERNRHQDGECAKPYDSPLQLAKDRWTSCSIRRTLWGWRCRLLSLQPR